MAEAAESRLQQIERLISEAHDLLPQWTSGRGSFSNMPPRYTARHPGDWMVEFNDVFHESPLGGLLSDADEIIPLIRVVNELALERPAVGTSNETLLSVLSYVVFEMTIRRLTPAIDGWGYLVSPVAGLTLGDRVSGLRKVLLAFEESTPLLDLRATFRLLNQRMVSRELDRGGIPIDLDLYGRIQRGRDLMLHGNLSHSFEGNLMVLLVDLVVLHVMKQAFVDSP